MLTFKSISDLSKLDPQNPAYPIIEDLVKRLCVDIPKEAYHYIPEDHGWINLVCPGDMQRIITEVWQDWRLIDVSGWEGVMRRDGHYIAIFLTDNEKGFIFVIPDENWLTDDLRIILEDHLDPQ